MDEHCVGGMSDALRSVVDDEVGPAGIRRTELTIQPVV
jgi:hypothetical protein